MEVASAILGARKSWTEHIFGLDLVRSICVIHSRFWDSKINGPMEKWLMIILMPIVLITQHHDIKFQGQLLNHAINTSYSTQHQMNVGYEGKAPSNLRSKKPVCENSFKSSLSYERNLEVLPNLTTLKLYILLLTSWKLKKTFQMWTI